MTGKLQIEFVPMAQVTAKPHTTPCRPLVLVVDDERVIADTLASILELSGYVATVAYDAREAMEIAEVIPPNLLITDVMMPGMTGVELAMELSRAIPDCKVLIFSGQATTLDLLDSARSAGFDFPALTKPVHPTAMLEHVSVLVPKSGIQYIF